MKNYAAIQEAKGQDLVEAVDKKGAMNTFGTEWALRYNAEMLLYIFVAQNLMMRSI